MQTAKQKKLVDKGANSACVKDSIVYGWAIHYFEEDSIEGKLFNEDGTEYKPIVKTVPKHSTLTKAEPSKPKQQQASLFDLISAPENKTATAQSDEHEPTIDEIADALQKAVDEKTNMPTNVIQSDGKTIDTDSGK